MLRWLHPVLQNLLVFINISSVFLWPPQYVIWLLCAFGRSEGTFSYSVVCGYLYNKELTF